MPFKAIDVTDTLCMVAAAPLINMMPLANMRQSFHGTANHLKAFVVECSLHGDQGTEHAVLLQHLVDRIADPALNRKRLWTLFLEGYQ